MTVQDIESGQWLAFMNAVPRLTAVADTEEKALGRLVIQIDVRHAEIEAFKASRQKAAERRKRKRNARRGGQS